jgi:glycosyltransferase involved in cell wall biosynthesis
MLNVNSKILWLSDFDLDEAVGGAQRSDTILIKKGNELGLGIHKVNYHTFNKAINIHDYDCVISSNLCAISQLQPWILDELSKHKYHVRIEHDSNEYLSQENRKKLFFNCKKTFFLTNYHYSFFKELYGDIFSNVEIVPDPIDSTVFCDKGQKREDKILYVGYMHPQKGSGNFFEHVLRNPDKKFALAGWSDYYTYNFLAEKIPNIEYLGLVEYESMPNVYNKYKSLYYEPNLREPFCRSVAEAILCGMLIATSKENQIGCIHDIAKYGINKFKENCNSAPTIFWNKV